MAIELKSPAFADGAVIPKKYTGEGEDVSPPLEWSGLPPATKELALVCDDPDAPTDEPWVHWVIYRIPPDLSGLPEGIEKAPRLKNPPGAFQGRNSWTTGHTTGYRGPMPPPGHGIHHYNFRLYALSAKLSVGPGLTRQALLEEISDHILGEGRLVGTYSR
jgi:Raf kinase inhibitor-like YbhB/YbcL family protein